MRLVNHPFRLDSQRLLSYLTSMRVLTLAVTPANSTTFWSTIYFYTASATAGNLSYDCARGTSWEKKSWFCMCSFPMGLMA